MGWAGGGSNGGTADQYRPSILGRGRLAFTTNEHWGANP